MTSRNHRSPVRTAGWVVRLAVAALATGPAAAGSFLVENGQPRADIVITTNASRMAAYAARELQEYVLKISGATLPVVMVPGGGGSNHVYVGRSAWTDALGLSATGLLYDAFQIASGTNWLALLGNDGNFAPTPPYNVDNPDIPRMLAEWDTRTGNKWGNPHIILYKDYSGAKLGGLWAHDHRGSLNAVHEYLRGLGARWFFPGDLGEVLPTLASLPLPTTNAVVRPDFAYRYLYFYYHTFGQLDATTNEIRWQLRLGMNPGWDVLGVPAPGHGISDVISRTETKQAHPEYYWMRGGVRDTNTYGPCLSSVGLYTQNLAYLQARFSIYSNDTPTASVMPTDGYTTLCECPLCAGKGSPDRGDSGKLSDYVWGYVNRVATNILATWPGKAITCCAYTAYQLPPTNIAVLSTNIIVGWCQYRSDFRDTNTWASYTNQMQTWLTKLPSRQVFRYDYYLHSGRPEWAAVPVYFPHLIARDLRFQQGKSLGEYIETYRNYGPNGDTWEALAANHLNCYVTTRLWWDANQDVDALLADYYQKFYGSAAAEMKGFVEYCESNWPSMKLDKTVMDGMLGRLDAAVAAAGTGIYSQRVALLVEFVKPIRALSESLNDRYAAQNGQTPRWPYASWATAASNIQDAVNAAGTNTGIRNSPIAIWVGAGRYTVPSNAVTWMGTNVVYIDRPMTLRSSNGAPESVVIDGQGTCRGIAMTHQRTTPYLFAIDGLTVSNGFATNWGGGIMFYPCNSGEVGLFTGLVQNCVITHSRAGGVWGGGYGGGIYGNQPNAVAWPYTLSNCLIQFNQALYGATNVQQGCGGGLGVVYGSGTVVNCSFVGNKATVGGGVYAVNGITLSGCRIIGNSVTSGTDRVSGASIYEPRGGGLYVSAPARLRNCLVAGNRSSKGSGGVMIYSGTGNELCNCTVVSNYSADVAGTYGGTVYIYPTSTVCQVVNCIVVSNTPVHARNSVEGAGACVTNCCLIPTNFGARLPAVGTVTNSPRFVNYAQGDYRLATDSPCINTGTNLPWMADAADLGGLARVINGRADMGAYECLPTGLQLRVVSGHGVADPAPGLYTGPSGARLTNAVSGIEPGIATQFVCTGWTVAGLTPASGTSTNMVLVLTNDAVLTWQWATWCWLATTNAGPGTVSPPSGWQELGSNVVLRAAPQSYYHLGRWSGSGTDFMAPADMQAPTATVTVCGAAAVTGTFEENLAANGVPEWWLAAYGYTNFGTAVWQDDDNDGLPVWQEWVAGTSPALSNETFRIGSLENLAGEGPCRVCWQTVTGRAYVVHACTNLMSDWTEVYGVAGNGAVRCWTNDAGGSGRFFLIEVRKTD